jgi:hypothetical protein
MLAQNDVGLGFACAWHGPARSVSHWSQCSVAGNSPSSRLARAGGLAAALQRAAVLSALAGPVREGKSRLAARAGR